MFKWFRRRRERKQQEFIDKIKVQVSMEVGYYLLNSKITVENLKQLYEFGEKNREEKGHSDYSSIAELLYQLNEINQNV